MMAGSMVMSRDQARPTLRRRELLERVVRWTSGRKERLLRGIAEGAVTAEDAMQAHGISADELAIWRENLARGGISDLRLKTIQLRPFRPSVTPALAFHPAQAGA